jgi:hypothetical protein
MTKSDMVTWLSRGRLLRSVGGKALIIFLLVATALGFTLLDSCVIRPGRSMKLPDRPGSGVMIRTECTHLWLPETLIELARNPSETLGEQTHEGLRIALDRREQQGLWYAFTLRSHQADGRTAESNYVRRPYREPENFRELPEILARAAGNPSPSPASRFSAAEIHILSREQSGREPREVVAELFSPPARPSKVSRESR